MSDRGELETMRHSCAHLMAAAIARLWPGARFGVGPATRDGFYYDVAVDPPIREADLPRIEGEMRALVRAELAFERRLLPIDDAICEMASRDQPYKLELVRLLRDRGSTAPPEGEPEMDEVPEAAGQAGPSHVSLYALGAFVDLCRGPHVASSSEIGPFALVAISGAYWRGDANRDPMQRISGLCFATEADLAHALWQREEARRRDHRVLGQRLRLFTFSDDVGLGLPIWLPRGTVLRDEIEALARHEERREGYERVCTPHITKEALYYRSRHLPYYDDDMYAPLEIDGERYYLSRRMPPSTVPRSTS